MDYSIFKVSVPICHFFYASRCNHNGHRESAYVMVNRTKTMPNTYLEPAVLVAAPITAFFNRLLTALGNFNRAGLGLPFLSSPPSH